MFRHTSLLAAVALASVLAGGITAAPAFAAATQHAAHARPGKHAQHGHKQQGHDQQGHRQQGHKQQLGHSQHGHKKLERLACRAEMSNGNPYQFATTDVLVTTAPGAMVEATARYLVSAVHEAAVADTHGTARIPYYISLSVPWYRVNVTVTVTSGDRTGSCATSFAPRLL